MRCRRVAALVLGAALALPQLGAGQSLAELAERERERRARSAKPPAPVYDDAALAERRGERPAAPAPSPSASPSPSPVAPVEDETALRKQQAVEWRIRFAEARERVARAEADSWRTVIDVVWHAGIPVQQEVRKFEETEELRKAKQALADLEEEYRRTGLPPGWVR
jgi:hypothetical protein